MSTNNVGPTSYVVRLTGGDVEQPLKHFRKIDDARCFARAALNIEGVESAVLFLVDENETRAAISSLANGRAQLVARFEKPKEPLDTGGILDSKHDAAQPGNSGSLGLGCAFVLLLIVLILGLATVH